MKQYHVAQIYKNALCLIAKPVVERFSYKAYLYLYILNIAT